MELFNANQQWKTRPADQRFPSIQSLYDQTKHYADIASEKDVPYANIRVEAFDNDVQVVGKAGIPAKLTNWAFGQLCARIGAPAGYLRDLPATLAAQNVNHGLARLSLDKANEKVARCMFHKNGNLVLRALTSDSYQRIWNYEVAERLLDMEADGWIPAMPTINLSEGEEGQSALYVSDHDMFAFIRHNDRVIKEAGTSEPLYRGAIAFNSEVGGGSIGVMTFLYREQCSNHIIWGASEVNEIRMRHIGSVRDRFNIYATELRRYLDSSADGEEAKIASAKYKLIADTKEKVLDVLFGKRSFGLSRKTLDASYEAVQPDEDGDPRSVWGFVQGVTRHSQETNFADERMKMDRAAGKILEADF